MAEGEGVRVTGYVVQVFKGSGRQPWFLRVVSVNGQVVLVSEGYATRWNAKRAGRKLGLPFVDLTKTPVRSGRL